MEGHKNQWYPLLAVGHWPIFLGVTVTTYMPFVIEKCSRKIRFEFMNDDKLRAIQVLVRFHQPEPKEGYEYSRQRYCSIPSVMSE